MVKRAKGSIDDELAALSKVASDPRSADSRARLLAALASRRAPVAARAARLVKEHAVAGFDDALAAAFARFLADGPKSDPMCQVKLATIEALDYAESRDPEPFLRAVRHVQPEGGGDSAAPLRSRAAVALARLGHDDFDLIVATLLADPIANVRQAAVEALAHRGDRAGAPLALLALRTDAEPAVMLAAMTTLLALAPEWALATLGELVDGDDGERRELAAVALGQSRHDQASVLLLDALARRTRAVEREPIIRGLGLHRSDRALAALVDLVANGRADDARAALEALAPRRFEPAVAARVRAAARDNDRADLGALADELFG